MTAHPHHHAWMHPEKARYYRVYLEQDLFGDWSLRKVWGGVGSRRGRMHNTGVTSYEDGLEQICEIEMRRVRRGYCAATGGEAPQTEAAIAAVSG